MTSEPIEAVIFDNDGTLVDSEVLSLSTMVDLAAESGLSISVDEAVELFAGSDISKVIEDFEIRLGGPLPDDFETEFRRRQIEVLNAELQPIEGAAELLSSMTLPFCVASNAPRNKINVCLKRTKLDRFFDDSRIFSAYDVRAWKPEPDLFLKAASDMGVRPSRCAVVEDSVFGIEAGITAGMQVFALDRHDRLAANSNCRSVSRLAELSRFFCILSSG